MFRKIISMLLIAILAAGCAYPQKEQEIQVSPKQYTVSFLELFDTVTTVVGQAESKETFEKTAYALPFVHAVEMEKALFSGEFLQSLSHLLPIALYCVAITVIAVFCFLRQMKKQ